MTTVYGVTFVGARDQIERQLKDKKGIPEEECWPAASYVAKKVCFTLIRQRYTVDISHSQTLLCISDLFSGARGIQTWLNLCARLIAKSIPEERLPEAMMEHTAQKNKRNTKTLPADRLKKEQMTSVVWTTPLGLPIVQPYRKANRKQIMTSLQTVYISDPNSPAEGEVHLIESAPY
jgi:DNA-directed RNA polymerase